MINNTATVADESFFALSTSDIVLRMLTAMLIGAVIGTEREYTHRPAGMRTHMLVSLGACTVMITGQMVFSMYYPYGVTPDPTRLSAQVITGVGFLGAGTILREGASIKGLTTAASIWTVACLGVSVGAGFFDVGAVGTVCMMTILVLFEWIQKKLMKERDSAYLCSISCADANYTLNIINKLASEIPADISCVQVKTCGADLYDIELKIIFRGRDENKDSQMFMEDISKTKCLYNIKVEKISAK